MEKLARVGDRVGRGRHSRLLFAQALREFESVRPANQPTMQVRFGTTRAKGGIWIELRPRVTGDPARAAVEPRALERDGAAL